MPNGIETQHLGVDPSVDPVILVVMLVAFLIGAVGPFALCVLGSIRDERAMRRYAAEGCRHAVTANPVDPAVVPVAIPLRATALPAPIRGPANDIAAPSRAVGS